MRNVRLAWLLVCAVSWIGIAGASPARAWTSADGTFEVHGFVENATYWREEIGISKFRNTAQLEFTKRLGDVGPFTRFEITGILRGTYDGVYDLNDNDFGDDAGGRRNFRSSALGAATPWGMSPLSTGVLGFGFDLAANPNRDLEVLGELLHNAGGGLTLGVPVRPCDKDDRGCLNDDYLNRTSGELRFPEFSDDRFDVIRELYARGSIKLGNGDFFDISIGRQQVVWGRTDLFRVLDVINPVDFSRQNIYDELEDIRIPMGILTLEYRAGATGIFEDLNFQALWKWEMFRPHELGQAGSPYEILDAGSLFRGLNTCWELGCTVSNFAPANPMDISAGFLATDFPANTIGIRDVKHPGWKLDETDIGGRIEGVIRGVGFSINALYYHSQLPSLRGGIPSRNPFLPDGAPCNDPMLGGPFCEFPTEVGGDLLVRSFVPAFDIHFPRLLLIGGSADIYWDFIKTAIRLEMAWTDGEEFANTKDRRSFSESDVIRWVAGFDRPTFIRFLNPKRSFLFSAQVFGQHLLDHDISRGPFGDVGMPDWNHNIISTLLIRGSYFQDRLNPQFLSAWDARARTFVFGPSVDWLISDRWRLIVGANFKVGRGAHKFDDARSGNAFPPFTCPGGAPCGVTSGSVGVRGFEPLGRFRAGPIGMAYKENEIQVTLRYRF